MTATNQKHSPERTAATASEKLPFPDKKAHPDTESPDDTPARETGCAGLARHAELGILYRAWHARTSAAGNANEDFGHQQDLLQAYARRQKFPTVDALEAAAFYDLVVLIPREPLARR